MKRSETHIDYLFVALIIYTLVFIIILRKPKSILLEWYFMLKMPGLEEVFIIFLRIFAESETHVLDCRLSLWAHNVVSFVRLLAARLLPLKTNFILYYLHRLHLRLHCLYLSDSGIFS